MKRFKWLPSPALVIAGVALVAALGGSAIALPGKNKIDGNDIGKNDVRTGDIKAGVVDSSDIRNAIIKDEDISAAALSPRAFGLVTADNNITEANSRVITDAMVNVEGNTFCFSGLPFTPRHVHATPEMTTASPDVYIQATVNPPYDASSCTGAEQAAVQMRDESLGSLITSADFFISFQD